MSKLRSQLIKGGVGSLFVNILRAGLSFILAVVLARFMGASEYGVYSFSFAILMLVAIPAQIGIPQLIVRETAKAQANQDWPLMRGLWHWGNFAVTGFSVFGILIAIAICSILIKLGSDSERLIIIVTGIALIPLMALTAVRGSCLRGLRKVIVGQLPDAFIRPIFFMGMIGVYPIIVEGDRFYSAESVMVMHVIAAVISFVVASMILSKVKPKELGYFTRLRYEKKRWRKAVIPLAAISGLHLVNNYSDIIILGIFRSDEEVGVYRAVFQISLLVVFGLQAINQVLHPHFARIYAARDMKKLQRLVTWSSRGILALAIFPAFVLVFFGDLAMEWIYGNQYGLGGEALSILVVGQLANAAFGSVAALLNMTGHENDTVRGLGISIFFNILLNFMLIPFWGMAGAAIATSASLLIWNFILRKAVWRRLSIESSALGNKKRRFL